jgi:hypothetical protein
VTVQRDITYGFTFKSRPDLDALIAELQAARQLIKGKTTVHVSAYDDERDGYGLEFTISGIIADADLRSK